MPSVAGRKEIGSFVGGWSLWVGGSGSIRRSQIGSWTSAQSSTALDNPHIRVRRTYVEGLGLQDTPKTKAGSRDTFITPDVVELLGEWLKESGNP